MELHALFKLQLELLKNIMCKKSLCLRGKKGIKNNKVERNVSPHGSSTLAVIK